MPTSYSRPQIPAIQGLPGSNMTNIQDGHVPTYNATSNTWINQSLNGIKVYTTTERNALTPYTGQVIYNTTDNALQVYDSGWTQL